MRGVAAILTFLQDDPYEFGSGYEKEAAWQLLKRVELTDSERARVLSIARSYLGRRVGREFRYMALFVRRIADAAFRAEVEQMGSERSYEVGKRARLLAAYLRDPAE